MTNRAEELFKPQFRFGMGGVSVGNEFNKHTDKEAEETLEAAWAVGVRYFDVAPWYGYGLAERRFGHFLHNQPRQEFLLSSKVGKLLKRPRTMSTPKSTRYPTRPMTLCSTTPLMEYVVRSRAACNASGWMPWT